MACGYHVWFPRLHNEVDAFIALHEIGHVAMKHWEYSDRNSIIAHEVVTDYWALMCMEEADIRITSSVRRFVMNHMKFLDPKLRRSDTGILYKKMFRNS